MDKTPGTEAAIEKMLAAVTEGETRDRYPSGTTFLAMDAPWSREALSSRLSGGGLVVLVSASGDESLISAIPSGTVTMGGVIRTSVIGYVSGADRVVAETPDPSPVRV
jgi:hypothetical protein